MKGDLVLQPTGSSLQVHGDGTDDTIGQVFVLDRESVVERLRFKLTASDTGAALVHDVVLWEYDPDTNTLVQSVGSAQTPISGDFSAVRKEYAIVYDGVAGAPADSITLQPDVPYIALLTKLGIASAVLSAHYSPLGPYAGGMMTTSTARSVGSTMTEHPFADLDFAVVGYHTSPFVGLDFGNGVIAGAGGNCTLVPDGHSGLEFPEVEMAALENSIRDGGSLGESRASMRRMTCKLFSSRLTHGTSALTHGDFKRAFSPDVLREISSTLAAMPYRVEFVEFVSTDRRKPPTAIVSMLSPDAYPACLESFEDVTGIGSIDSESEVACPLRVIVTVPAGGGSQITIVSPAGTTTLDGTFAAGDIVVVDPAVNGGEYAVTHNDADALSYFDRAGEWPRLDAGSSVVAVRLDGTVIDFTATWRPRLLGLVV